LTPSVVESTAVGVTQGVVENQEETTVGYDDKVRNEAEELKGKAKERYGDLTDDERMEAEGKGEQVKANLKQAGEKVKDAFRD
jgi:uncharacterized protein YjbJ (UPF0337 family)